MGYALMALITLGVLIAIILIPIAVLSIVNHYTINQNNKKIWYFNIVLSLIIIALFISLESFDVLGSGWSFPLIVIVLIFMDKWTKQDVLIRFGINPIVPKILNIGLMLLIIIKFVPPIIHSFQNAQ
jgi:hypothetical protein